MIPYSTLICLGTCGVHFSPDTFWQVPQETVLICIRCFMGKMTEDFDICYDNFPGSRLF